MVHRTKLRSHFPLTQAASKESLMRFSVEIPLLSMELNLTSRNFFRIRIMVYQHMLLQLLLLLLLQILLLQLLLLLLLQLLLLQLLLLQLLQLLLVQLVLLLLQLLLLLLLLLLQLLLLLLLLQPLLLLPPPPPRLPAASTAPANATHITANTTKAPANATKAPARLSRPADQQPTSVQPEVLTFSGMDIDDPNWGTATTDDQVYNSNEFEGTHVLNFPHIENRLTDRLVVLDFPARNRFEWPSVTGLAGRKNTGNASFESCRFQVGRDCAQEKFHVMDERALPATRGDMWFQVLRSLGVKKMTAFINARQYIFEYVDNVWVFHIQYGVFATINMEIVMTQRLHSNDEHILVGATVAGNALDSGVDNMTAGLATLKAQEATIGKKQLSTQSAKLALTNKTFWLSLDQLRSVSNAGVYFEPAVTGEAPSAESIRAHAFETTFQHELDTTMQRNMMQFNEVAATMTARQAVANHALSSIQDGDYADVMREAVNNQLQSFRQQTFDTTMTDASVRQWFSDNFDALVAFNTEHPIEKARGNFNYTAAELAEIPATYRIMEINQTTDEAEVFNDDFRCLERQDPRYNKIVEAALGMLADAVNSIYLTTGTIEESRTRLETRLRLFNHLLAIIDNQPEHALEHIDDFVQQEAARGAIPPVMEAVRTYVQTHIRSNNKRKEAQTSEVSMQEFMDNQAKNLEAQSRSNLAQLQLTKGSHKEEMARMVADHKNGMAKMAKSTADRLLAAAEFNINAKQALEALEQKKAEELNERDNTHQAIVTELQKQLSALQRVVDDAAAAKPVGDDKKASASGGRSGPSRSATLLPTATVESARPTEPPAVVLLDSESPETKNDSGDSQDPFGNEPEPAVSKSEPVKRKLEVEVVDKSVKKPKDDSKKSKEEPKKDPKEEPKKDPKDKPRKR